MTGPGTGEAGKDAVSDGASARPEASDIIVLTRGVSELETAAVTAVLEAVLAELGEDRFIGTTGPSLWQRRARNLRAPIGPGHLGWRDFAS